MANEFNFDDDALYKEFDLGADFDQPDLPPNRVAAVGRALKDIIGEAAPAMGRAVKSKLSDELMDASTVLDEGFEIVSDFQRLKDDIAKEIVPAFNTLKIITRRVLPKAKSFVPSKIYGKTQDYLNRTITEPVREKSDEERRADYNNQTVADSIKTIFANQAAAQRASETERVTEKFIDRQLDSGRFKMVGQGFSLVTGGVGGINSFLRGTFTDYLKKDIELKYHHLFIAKDTFNALKVTAGILDKRLQEIKHNTGLPESVKASDPRFRKGSGRIEAPYQYDNYLSQFRGKLMQNIHSGVMDSIKMVTQMGIPMLDMMTQPGMPGFTLPQLIGKGVGWLGSIYARNKTQQFIDKNGESFDLLRTVTDNLKDRLTMRLSNWANKAMSSDSTWKYWLASMVPTISADMSTKNDLIDQPDAPASFDVMTRQSIVEIIPAHLSFIGKHIKGLTELMAPGVKFSDITYNPVKREITSLRTASKDMVMAKVPNAGSIAQINTDTMNNVKRAALLAAKETKDSEEGKKIISNVDNMQDDLLKFFINSGVKRRFLDLELLMEYVTDPYHTHSDYTSDVLDGIDEPVNFATTLIATLTDQNTGKIDEAALAVIENGIISYTKKIDITRAVPIVSNIYGGTSLLKHQGLVDEKGAYSMEGIRKFYGQTKGPEQEFYLGGKKLTPEEAREKGYTSGGSSFGLGYDLEKDAKIEIKRRELLQTLRAKGGDDPRIDMLESGNPVMVAMALAMGDSDSIMSKVTLAAGSAGKWVYDKANQAVDWASEKFGESYDKVSDLYRDLDMSEVIEADEKLTLISVERLSSTRFKCTAKSETNSKTAELKTKVPYESGRFPDMKVLRPFCKKQKWKVGDPKNIVYIDNVSVSEDEEVSSTVTSGGSLFGGTTPVYDSLSQSVVPTYLQYILEAIYIANGKKKLIPKVNLSRFGYAGAGPSYIGPMSTPSEQADNEPPKTRSATYAPMGAAGILSSVLDVPEETLKHYTSGDAIAAGTEAVSAVASEVKADAAAYMEKLSAYLPTKESFLSKFSDPNTRAKMEAFWDAAAAKGAGIKQFLKDYCEEIKATSAVKAVVEQVYNCAKAIKDPNDREKFVADSLARIHNLYDSVSDPNKRESLFEDMKRRAAEKLEELKTTSEKKSGGLFGLRTIHEQIKKGWNKFRETRFYKWVSSKIPPEYKEKIKKQFFDAKKDVSEAWDEAMEELKKWADPEGYAKRKREEMSIKKLHEERATVFVEDGEMDPYLQEMMDEANGKKPKSAKEKKPSLWSRIKGRFSRAKDVYKEERQKQKEEAEEERRARESEADNEERKSLWTSINENIKGLFRISKKKEDKEKESEKNESKNNKVNREARQAFNDVSFVGPSGSNDAFHSDFLTFANTSLKLLDAIRVNSGIGVMSFLQTLVGGGFGFLGKTAGALGTVYGGLLRGTGSALGGLARGTGSLLGGIFKSGLPTALIKAGGSIIGGGLKGWGHAVGGTATGLGAAAGGAANLGSGILNTLFGTGSITAASVMNFGRRLTRPKFIDIYRKDKIEPGKPLLSAKKQEEGVYFADGSLVKNSMDIKAPVFEHIEGDPNPRTLITDEDIKAGLCDAKGTPLVENTAIFKGQFSGFAGMIANGLGIAALGVGTVYKKIAEWLGVAIPKAGEVTATMLGRLFGIDTEGTQNYHKQMLSNFALLLELLKSSYYVSYTREEHEQNLKESDRERKYEDRLDAEEQKRSRSSNRTTAFDRTSGAAAGGVGGSGSGGSGDGPGDNSGGGSSGLGFLDGVGLGAGGIGAGKLIKDGIKSVKTKGAIRGNADAAKKLARQSREAFKAAEHYEKAGNAKKAKQALDKAIKLEKKSKDALDAARRIKDGKSLTWGQRFRNIGRTIKGVGSNTWRGLKAAGKGTWSGLKAAGRGIASASRWTWDKAKVGWELGKPLISRAGQYIASHAPKVAAWGSKALPVLGKIGSFVGKAALPLEIIIGAGRGLTLDKQEQAEHLDEWKDGWFGGGHLLTGRGWESIADAEGFWGTTGAVFRGLGNTVGQFLDVYGNVKNVTAQTKGLIQDMSAARDSYKKTLSPARTQVFLKSKLSAIDRHNVDTKFGTGLADLLRNKYTVAFTEQGAPDDEWGRKCVNACDKSIIKSFVADEKLDVNLLVANLDECINKIGMEDAYTYVYGDQGTIEILETAKKTIQEYVKDPQTARANGVVTTDTPTVKTHATTPKASGTDGQSFTYGEFTLTKAELDAAYDKAKKELGRNPNMRTVVQDVLIAKYGDKFDSEISSSERRAVLGAIETMYRRTVYDKKSVPTDSKPAQPATIKSTPTVTSKPVQPTKAPDVKVETKGGSVTGDVLFTHKGVSITKTEIDEYINKHYKGNKFAVPDAIRNLVKAKYKGQHPFWRTKTAGYIRTKYDNIAKGVQPGTKVLAIAGKPVVESIPKKVTAPVKPSVAKDTDVIVKSGEDPNIFLTFGDVEKELVKVLKEEGASTPTRFMAREAVKRAFLAKYPNWEDDYSSSFRNRLERVALNNYWDKKNTKPIESKAVPTATVAATAAPEAPSTPQKAPAGDSARVATPAPSVKADTAKAVTVAKKQTKSAPVVMKGDMHSTGTAYGNVLMRKPGESDADYQRRFDHLKSKFPKLLPDTPENRKIAESAKKSYDRNLETKRLEEAHQARERRREAIAAKISSGKALTPEEEKFFFSGLDSESSAATAAPEAPSTPQKAKVTITRSDAIDRQHNIDSSKEMPAKESPIVKKAVASERAQTRQMKEIASNKPTGDPVADQLKVNDVNITTRLDALISLMGQNINAVNNAGDMTRSHVSTVGTRALANSMQYTNGAVDMVRPKPGPRITKPSAISVTKTVLQPA